MNKVKHVPMLFSTTMMQANLMGAKKKTRRKCNDFIQNYAMQIHRLNNGEFQIETANDRQILKPKVNVGDVIWCRETFYAYGHWTTITQNGKSKKVFQDLTLSEGLSYSYFDSNPIIVCKFGQLGWHKRPSLFMPKSACRLWLKVTNVRIERLQDISEQDSIDEGINALLMSSAQLASRGQLYQDYSVKQDLLNNGLSPIDSYKTLWEIINGIGSWDENPFVWVYEYEAAKMPQGFLTRKNTSK
jgi:hypothetical protein